jgi:glutamate-1-semialdehyde 2,1-aminomutase
MKIVAILQARMNSTRLPGKVLKPILGKPLLALELERVRRAKRVDHILVATSVDPSDDSLEALCAALHVSCFRGDLQDVLGRYYHAARASSAEHIVRLTGDCPLADPAVIDRVIGFYLAGNYDYVSNVIAPTFPDGLDVEVFRFRCLEEAFHEAKLPSQREHVTLFLQAQPDRYRLGNCENNVDLSHLRWTVDEPADFELVQSIYEALYPNNPSFTTTHVLDFLEKNPQLKMHNLKHHRNEGLAKSLREDERAAFSAKLRNGLALQERAKQRIPGLTQVLSKRPDMFSYGVWPGYFSRAKGAEVWDADGNHYLDMSISGIGANVLGYADPDVDEKVVEAIAKGTSCSLNCPEEVELAEVLCDLHPWANRVRFARTGGESMAIAVRIARASTGRDKIAFCGYHGWHDWYLAANIGTGNALGEHLISGLLPHGVPKSLAGTALPFRYNNIDELKSIAVANRTELAAIVMEPIRNVTPEPEFIRAVREIADDLGAVLVIDEISAAFRMNTGGAHLKLGFAPDIAVFSKALGNGYPIAAVIGKDAVMEAAQHTFVSSTLWTERIGPVAALATIEKHRRFNVSEHLKCIGEMVQAGWQKLAAHQGVDIHIGGIPQLGHFRFKGDRGAEMKAYFIQLMLCEGFLASTLFYPMYAHTPEHVGLYLEAAERAFDKIAAATKRGDLAEQLIGRPAVIGFERLN